MKKFLFLLLPFSALSQYFQQDVSYQIEVKLDDKNHFLSGFETLTYKNNSPQTLNEIYMHVWPNAYKNKETALAQQLKRNEGNKLAKADPKDLGYIDSLDFKVNGAAVQWSYTPEHQDIVVLKLATPLKSKSRLVAFRAWGISVNPIKLHNGTPSLLYTIKTVGMPCLT
jgi:hypothetical protein